MKAILGGFRTTPTAAMEMETNRKPPWLRLQTKTLFATTRIQSLPTKHPYKNPLTKALPTRTACILHRLNLENVLQQFPYVIERLATIETHIRHSRWTPRAKIKVEATKDDSQKIARNNARTC